ncbi:MAG: hypothetical protein J1F35_07260 [Erysipelotrichales bacterium]|nr:hypothetical protein [Erysipelotrichales bacterium]
MMTEEIKLDLTNYIKDDSFNLNDEVNEVTELEIEKVKLIINHLSQMGIKSVLITGAENIDNFTLGTIVLRIKEKGINQIKLYTREYATQEYLDFINQLRNLGLTEVIYSYPVSWYQENAMRTINNFENTEMLRLNAYTGIIGEYGEFFDYIKKLYTHNLADDKKDEILNLAPNELGDLVWYLSTSLALCYDYSLNEIYSHIIDPSNTPKQNSYDINLIDDYIRNYEGINIADVMMNFKRILNKLDEIESKESAIEAVSKVLIEIASIARFLFNKNLSEILVSNIEKLRKRYPTGFDIDKANERIDANKKYKEEDGMKVRNLTSIDTKN